jgi:hypothetical protein
VEKMKRNDLGKMLSLVFYFKHSMSKNKRWWAWKNVG